MMAKGKDGLCPILKRVYPMLNKNVNIERLISKIGSKNDYLPRTLGEARADFIRRAKETVVDLREGKVRPYHPARMARQQKKTKLFCVKIGYGGNNAYMPNPVHKASQVLKYGTAEEAASDIETIIIPAAKAGRFDEGLETILEQHKKLAEQRRAVMAANQQALVDRPQNAPGGSPAAAAE
jgi:hypothetical protein